MIALVIAATVITSGEAIEYGQEVACIAEAREDARNGTTFPAVYEGILTLEGPNVYFDPAGRVTVECEGSDDLVFYVVAGKPVARCEPEETR